MIKFSGIEISSKIPLEIKNKQCLALFFQQNTKNVYYSATRNILYVLFIGVHNTGASIYYLTLLQWKSSNQKYRCYIVLSLVSGVFTNIRRVKPLYEAVGCRDAFRLQAQSELCAYQTANEFPFPCTTHDVHWEIFSVIHVWTPFSQHA